MKKYIILIILFCPLLMAGKIYKWTDETGKVHFSQTPGPSQELNTVYRDTNKKKKLRKTLNGNWYGTSAGIKYQLRFKDDSFYFSVLNDRNSRYNIGQGYFDNDNGVLNFKYTNNRGSKKKGGLTEKYLILKFTLSQLSLRSKNNKQYDFIKFLKYNPAQSKYHKDLYGVWLNVKNGEILDFTASSFYKFEKGQYEKSKRGSLYRGNWMIKDNIIEFQYTGISKFTDKIGLIEHYNIVYSNELLTISNPKTGIKNKYTKQILGGSLLQ